MACHFSDIPASDSRRLRSVRYPVTKRLPLILFSHMLLLGLAQAVVHIVAPAAKPPAIPTVRIVSRKDGGTRKKRSLVEDVSGLEDQATLTDKFELPDPFSDYLK